MEKNLKKSIYICVYNCGYIYMCVYICVMCVHMCVYLHICMRKVVAESCEDTGVLGLRRRKFNPGPGMRLDHSELLCNKVLLKYKGDRESF